MTDSPAGLGSYARQELLKLGIAEVGDNVRVDRSCRFYGSNHIHIGSNSRIDAYCVISASAHGLWIGDYVHLSAGVTILGRERVTIESFVALSARVSVFTSNDDYTGGGIVNPTVPEEFRRVDSSPVVFRRHTVVGAGSVVMPGVTTGVGAAIGALSFVKQSVDDFAVVAGCPARKVGERSKAVLDREAAFLATAASPPRSQVDS